jgi:hypothetical protein
VGLVLAATSEGNIQGNARKAVERVWRGGRARQRGRQRLGGAAVALSKVQSVDERMRLECGVGFRQLRTCRRIRPGQLCANTGTSRSLKSFAPRGKPRIVLPMIQSAAASNSSAM